MAEKPTVSVIIPLKQLSYYLIYEALPKLAEQSFKKFEIIVLPNEHAQYDITLLKKYKNLRIIPTGKITRPAEKRDIGVKNAKGEIIAFLDDDAYPDEHWIENAVKLFKKYDIMAVGGPGALPSGAEFWEKVFDEVLKTSVGAGGFSYRFTPRKRRYVSDFPSMNFFIPKKIFQKLGGFNSDYWPGEDSKLCNDLIEKEKGKILYHPEVLVYHHRRNELKTYLKQHGQYGFHRGAFFAHGDKNSREITYLIPTFFLIYLSFAVIIAPYIWINTGYRILYAPLLLYSVLLFFVLIKSFFNTRNIIISLCSALVLLLTHLVYGFMFIKGFLKGLNKNENIYGKESN